MLVPNIPFLSQDGSIFAGAGAGKTTTSVTLHAHAQSQGHRVIVITFTNATVSDYIRRANAARQGLASADNVLTFHKLAALVLSSSHGAEDASLDTVVALALEHAHQHGPPACMKGVRVYLVDESQDCSRENYELVKCIADGMAHVVMIGDANQCLYRFRNASSQYLLQHGRPEGFVHELVTNWRSTPELVTFSRQFMRHPLAVSAAHSACSGPRPLLITRPHKEAVMCVIAAAQEALSSGDDVFIVGRSKRPRYEKHRLVRMGLQTIVNRLHAMRIPYQRLFKESSDDDSLASGLAPRRDRVNLLTIHGSKGLEANSVIVIDAIDEIVGTQPCRDQLELMYVAFSRPRRALTIVNTSAARCDSILTKCTQQGLCRLDGDQETTTYPVLRDISDRISVTQLISDRTILDETSLLELSRSLIQSTRTFARPHASSEMLDADDLPEIGDLKAFYGELAENCLQMSYSAAQDDPGSTPTCNAMRRLHEFCSQRVVLEAKHTPALAKLFAATGARRSDSMTRENLQTLLAHFQRHPERYARVIAMLQQVANLMDARGLSSAIIMPSSGTQKVNLSELLDIQRRFSDASSNRARLDPLFHACMFFFQYGHHAGYRWGKAYVRHIEAFMPHLCRIEQMASQLPPGCTFEKEVNFKLMRLIGRIDAVCACKIVELKFVSQLCMTHFLQPCLYATLDNAAHPKAVEVWNLASGEKVAVKYNVSPSNRWQVFKQLASCLKKSMIVEDLLATERCGGVVHIRSDAARMEHTVSCPEDVAAECAFIDAGLHGIAWRKQH